MEVSIVVVGRVDLDEQLVIETAKGRITDVDELDVEFARKGDCGGNYVECTVKGRKRGFGAHRNYQTALLAAIREFKTQPSR